MPAYSLRPHEGATRELRFAPLADGSVHVFGWQGNEGRIVDRALPIAAARARYRRLKGQGWVPTPASPLAQLRARARV